MIDAAFSSGDCSRNQLFLLSVCGVQGCGVVQCVAGMGMERIRGGAYDDQRDVADNR